MIISLVVAMAENRVIGKDNALPWHLPNDFKHFKSVTMGKPCVMGRKTFDSIGKALPHRTNIILTTQKDFHATDCLVVHDIEQAIEVAKQQNAPELMIIGGTSIYQLFYEMCDKIYLTLVHTSIPGDSHFLPFEQDNWKKLSDELHQQDEKHQYEYSFITYQRNT